MSVEKSEMKAAITHDYGCRVDDFLEVSEATTNQLRGEMEAYKKATVLTQKIASILKSDLDSGKFENLTEIQVADNIKTYLDRVCNAMDKLSKHAQVEVLRTEGEARALNKVVGLMKKDYEAERKRVLDLRSAARTTDERSEQEAKNGTPIESAQDLDPNVDPKETVLFINTETAEVTEMPDPTRRPVGAHPGRGLAAERKKQTLDRMASDVIQQEQVEEPVNAENS